MKTTAETTTEAKPESYKISFLIPGRITLVPQSNALLTAALDKVGKAQHGCGVGEVAVLDEAQRGALIAALRDPAVVLDITPV